MSLGMMVTGFLDRDWAKMFIVLLRSRNFEHVEMHSAGSSFNAPGRRLIVRPLWVSDHPTLWSVLIVG